MGTNINGEQRRRDYGMLDAFNTRVTRHPDSESQKAILTLNFPNDTGNARDPAIAVGLSALDFDRERNIRVDAHVDNASRTKAEAVVRTWSDSRWYFAESVHFKASAGDQRIQMGQFGTWEDHEGHQEQTSRRINFPHPYGHPPNVIVWLNYLDFAAHRNARIRAHVTDVTMYGFTIHLDTWADSLLYGARATWIAHPKEMLGMHSGSVNITDFRPWNEPQRYNSHSVVFPPGKFKSPPTVVLALDNLDVDGGNNLRVKVHPSAVTKEGFTWNIDSWSDTIIYAAGASFIAYEN